MWIEGTDDGGHETASTLTPPRLLPSHVRRHLRRGLGLPPGPRPRQGDRGGSGQSAVGPSSRAPALPGEGQVGHPPLHERRPQPDGPVRPQADARQASRRAVLRQDRRGGRVHQGRRRLDAQPVPVRPARTVRRVGLRGDAAPRRHGGRPRVHPLHVHDEPDPRAGRLPHSVRQDGAGPARCGARGSCTDLARRTRTCRLTSFSTIRRDCRSTAWRTGKRASCRRCSRARASAPPARRS